jgi:hypothetical protein
MANLCGVAQKAASAAQCPFHLMSAVILRVGVEDSQPKGLWFESLLEQILFKTKAVKSDLGNRNMTGKIPTWWENSVRSNRRTAGKNSDMVGNFPW